MKSIDELAANLDFTTARTGEDRSVTFLPDPPRAQRRYTVISVDDHIVEPPDTFTGRLPRSSPTARPGSSTPTTAGRPGFTTVSDCPTSGSTPWWAGRCRSTASSRSDSTKCAAAHGISTSESRTWTSTASTPRSTSRPSCPGFAGQRLQQVTKDRDLALASVRAWNDWHLEVLGGLLPRTHHSLPAAVAAGPRARRDDDPGERRARLSRRHVQREPGHARIAQHPLRPLGSDDGRLRRDRHRRQPAHRVVGVLAVHHRRCAAGRAGRAVLRLCHLGGGRLAVLGTAQQIPGTQDLPVRRRNRLGRRAARPPRPHAQLSRDVRHLAGRSAKSSLPPRCSPATSGSAPWRTSRRSCSATGSAWTTSCSKPTIRTATPRGRTPSRRSTNRSATCRRTMIRKITWENASRLYRHPVPDDVQRDPDAF